MVLFFVLTVLCYVDRTNLAFAALQLNRDLHFSHRIYGLGSGLFFFIGYVTFQAQFSASQLAPSTHLPTIMRMTQACRHRPCCHIHLLCRSPAIWQSSNLVGESGLDAWWCCGACWPWRSPASRQRRNSMSCGWHLGLLSQAPCRECGERWLLRMSIPVRTILYTLMEMVDQAPDVYCATLWCGCHAACDQQQQA